MFKIKKILKKFKLRDYPSPSWENILRNHKKDFEILKKKANGKKILISTSTGGHHFCSHFESLLAFALTYYGSNVEVLLCDGLLPGCMMSTSNIINEKEFANNGPKKICNGCLDAGKFAFDGLGLKLNYYSEFINSHEIEEISNLINKMSYEELKIFNHEKINIGEHALAGALRYYAVGELDYEDKKIEILRRFVKAGFITKQVITNFYKKNTDIEITLLNHGIYVPQGIINSVSKKFNKRIVTYVAGYRKNSFIFSHDDTYHHTMIKEPTKDWENINLSKEIDKKIMDYLKSRSLGTNDWTYYFDKPNFEIKKTFEELGINLNKPIVGMLTNIIWDAQLIYPDNIFKSMVEWIFETIDYFKNRKDIQLVIRAHPGEINYDRESKQKVKDEILKRYKKLPENIFVIGSENSISTYTFAGICEPLIIYATKMGMEFSPLGQKVICAGESYIKNKDITMDPNTKEEYFKILDQIPFKEKLSEGKINRAKLYAYHFFFRRTIAPAVLDEKKGKWPPFSINSQIYEVLEKNGDKQLKQIVNSIINNEPFIYNDEKNV